MRGTNFMIFSRDTMKEIVEDYVRKNYNWADITVESFQQRKHRNAAMFEVTLTQESDVDAKRNPTDET